MKRLGVVLLVTIAVFAVLLAILWSRRIEVAQGVLNGTLQASLGVPVEVTVRSFELDGVDLERLRIGGDQGLHVERIALAYSVAGLARRSLDAIHIEGVRFQAAVSDDGELDLGPLDALLTPSDAGSGPTPIVLPAPRVKVEDVLLELSTSRGPVRITAHADLEEAGPERPPGEVEGEIRVLAEHAEVGGDAVVALSGPLAALDGQLTLRPRLDLPGLSIGGDPEISGRFSLGGEGPSGTLEVPALPVRYRSDGLELDGVTPALALVFAAEAGKTRFAATGSGGRLGIPGYRIEGLALDLESDGTSVSGSVSAKRIIDLAKPALFAPVSLEASVRGPVEALEIRAVARDPGGHLVVHIDGEVAPLGAEITADGSFRMEPVDFGPGAADFAKLLPSLAPTFGLVTGRVTAFGKLSLRNGKPDAEVDLALEDVDSVNSTATLRSVNGTLAFEGVDTIVSRGDQLLSVGLLEAGLPLTNGLIRWRLLPGMLLDVPAANFQVAGGEIRCGVRMDLDEDGFEVVLVALSLDIERLLASVDLEGLDGSGFISGALPLEIGSDSIVMRSAVLRGDQPGGTIRYTPDASASNVAKQQASSLGIAVDALSDLRWEILEMSLDGDTSGVMQIGLRVSGNNPEFHDGHPVQFNLNIEARLADLVRAGIESYRVPGAIEERLRRFGEKPAGALAP